MIAVPASNRSAPFPVRHRAQAHTGLLDLFHITLGIGQAETVREIVKKSVQIGLGHDV